MCSNPSSPYLISEGNVPIGSPIKLCGPTNIQVTVSPTLIVRLDKAIAFCVSSHRKMYRLRSSVVGSSVVVLLYAACDDDDFNVVVTTAVFIFLVVTKVVVIVEVVAAVVLVVSVVIVVGTLFVMPAQTPALHVSLNVSDFPSSQLTPSIVGLVHKPATHNPTLWHWLEAWQTTSSHLHFAGQSSTQFVHKSQNPVSLQYSTFEQWRCFAQGEPVDSLNLVDIVIATVELVKSQSEHPPQFVKVHLIDQDEAYPAHHVAHLGVSLVVKVLSTINSVTAAPPEVLVGPSTNSVAGAIILLLVVVEVLATAVVDRLQCASSLLSLQSGKYISSQTHSLRIHSSTVPHFHSLGRQENVVFVVPGVVAVVVTVAVVSVLVVVVVVAVDIVGHEHVTKFSGQNLSEKLSGFAQPPPGPLQTPEVPYGHLSHSHARGTVVVTEVVWVVVLVEDVLDVVKVVVGDCDVD